MGCAPTFFAGRPLKLVLARVDAMDMCPLQRSSQPPTETPRLERADEDRAHRQRLEQLRRALRDGSYRPSAQRIASRLLASGDLG